MKKYNYLIYIITSFVSSIIIVGCTSTNKFNGTIVETPYVYIEIDTITLHTDKDCVSGIMFQDMFYVYNLNYGYQLAVFDKYGNLSSSSPLPDNIDRYWMLSYAVKKDSLFAINENRNIEMYSLDKKSGSWILINNTEVPIYEDNQYKVLKTSHGEWGGMVYFIDKNKNTNKIYRAFSNEVVNVNKFNDKYYVTNYLGHLMEHSSIFEITDPKQMEEFHGSINDIVKNCAESSEKERYIFEGIENIVDTFSIRVVGSFVHKGRLLQMWNEYKSKKVYLTESCNGKLECRYIFDFGMKVKYLYCLDNDKHFLNFDIDDRSIFGVMGINNDKIKIHFLDSRKQKETDKENES